MRIAILDKNRADTQLLVKQICVYINPDIDLYLATFTEESEMLELIADKQISPEIFFIDNESCTPLALMVIKEKIKNPRVITMSSQNKYHIERCLVKPYHLAQLYTLLHLLYKNRQYHLQEIKVKTKNGIRFLNIKDILYFESYYGKVYVHTLKNTYIASTNEIYRYESALVHCGFISIHKSLLINREYIIEANVNQYKMKNNKILYPSVRRKRAAFRQFQNRYR